MAALPKTYKAVALAGANAPFQLCDVELKHPGPNEILVKVLACGVCYSDVALAQGHMGDSFPRVPGHEIIGDVVELGAGVDRFALGQRVGGPWHGGHDGYCKQCQGGQFQLCDHQAINGVTRDGGYAEYVILRQEAVVRVPKELDPAEVAPLLCAGITVFNGIRKLHVAQGALVAVIGLGGLGHLAVQYARHMGYEVAVLSSGDDKATFARELGAAHYINTQKTDGPAELANLGGASIIVYTAPTPRMIHDLMGGLACGGKLLCLSPAGDAEVSTSLMIARNLSLVGWPSGHAVDSEEAIRFAQAHGIKCMIEKYPFAEVQKAVGSLIAGEPRFRNVLVMDLKI